MASCAEIKRQQGRRWLKKPAGGLLRIPGIPGGESALSSVGWTPRKCLCPVLSLWTPAVTQMSACLIVVTSAVSQGTYERQQSRTRRFESKDKALELGV